MDPSTISAGPTVIVVEGASRKQNVACDPCRAKKIKCKRTTIDESCPQCVTKQVECTSFYVEHLLSKQKQPRKRGDAASAAPLVGRKRSGDQLASGSASPDKRALSGLGLIGREPISRYEEGESSSGRRHSVYGAVEARALSTVSTATGQTTGLPLSAAQKQDNLLRYLFSPVPVLHRDWGYDDVSSIEACSQGLASLWEEQNGVVWAEQPTAAHLGVSGDTATELAHELVHSFLTVCLPRRPTMNPKAFQDRINSPDTHPSGPLPHVLVAAALAAGSRFSDSLVLAQDRDELAERDRENGSGAERSRISQLLVIRARDIMERSAVLRVPSHDSINALIHIDYALGEAPALQKRSHTFISNPICKKLTTEEFLGLQMPQAERVVSHMRSLGWTDPGMPTDAAEKLSAVDQTAAVCYAAIPYTFCAFARLAQPLFSAEELDTEFGLSVPGPSDVNGAPSPGPDIPALASLAQIFHRFSSEACTRRSRTSGVPLAAFRDLVHDLSQHRDKYLGALLAPGAWPEKWDYLAVANAMHLDMWAASAWTIGWKSCRDLGIREERASGAGAGGRPSGSRAEAASIRSRLQEEGEHSAMRTAAQAIILTEHGYMRLDPYILLPAVYEAGMCLALQGKEEALACIEAIKQNAISYGSVHCLAEDIERSLVANMASGDAGVPAIDGLAAQAAAPHIDSASEGDVGLPGGAAGVNGSLTRAPDGWYAPGQPEASNGVSAQPHSSHWQRSA